MLKNNLYKRQNFTYPESYETTKVPKKHILRILQDPVRNRRGEFVFKDKSLLDFAFD